MGDVDSKEVMCKGGQGRHENSAPSIQFYCEPKIAFKDKNLLNETKQKLDLVPEIIDIYIQEETQKVNREKGKIAI